MRRAHLRRGIAGMQFVQSQGKSRRALTGPVAVEQQQRLRGGGGDAALRHVRNAVGRIERRQHGIGLVAHHFQIHRAAHRLCAILARTAGFQVQLARSRQQRIAHLLRIQPSRRVMPQEHIFRVGQKRLLDIGTRIFNFTLHSIRCAGHHQPVYLFQAPAVFHECRRQPVEQFGMCRLVAEAAKVARVRRQPATEMLLPQAVHQHARGERIFRRSNPVRQRRAPASGLQRSGGWHNARGRGVNDAWETRSDVSSRFRNARWRGRRACVADHKFRNGQRLRFQRRVFFQFGAQFFPLHFRLALQPLRQFRLLQVELPLRHLGDLPLVSRALGRTLADHHLDFVHKLFKTLARRVLQ